METFLNKIRFIVILDQKLKTGLVFLIVLLGVWSKNIAQEVSCSDLIDFIETKGYYKNSLDSYQLDSSWLYKITAYSYEYKIFIIAEIKRNEYSYSTDTYIFCGIPSNNWSSFIYGEYAGSDSYGERFHKYIINYKCNCY